MLPDPDLALELDERLAARLDDATLVSGRVTATAPNLQVAVGGSSVSYTNVQTIASGLEVDNTVLCAFKAKSVLIVLGKIGGTNTTVIPPAATITGTASLPGQSSPGSMLKIVANTVAVDNRSWWNAANSRYIPQLAGRYLVSGTFYATAVGAVGGFWDLSVAKNGTAVPTVGNAVATRVPSANTYGPYLTVAGQILMNGTTDYLELFGGQTPNSSVAGTERLDIIYLGPQ